MKIELSNGYAEVKEIYTRGLAKKVQEIMMEGIEMTAEGKNTIAKGFSIKNTEKATDYLLSEMITKLVINNKEKEINTETFDEMNTVDYNKIKNYIDSLGADEEDKKK